MMQRNVAMALKLLSWVGVEFNLFASLTMSDARDDFAGTWLTDPTSLRLRPAEIGMVRAVGV